MKTRDIIFFAPHGRYDLGEYVFASDIFYGYVTCIEQDFDKKEKTKYILTAENQFKNHET